MIKKLFGFCLVLFLSTGSFSCFAKVDIQKAKVRELLKSEKIQDKRVDLRAGIDDTGMDLYDFMSCFELSYKVGKFSVSHKGRYLSIKAIDVEFPAKTSSISFNLTENESYYFLVSISLNGDDSPQSFMDKLVLTRSLLHCNR